MAKLCYIYSKKGVPMRRKIFFLVFLFFSFSLSLFCQDAKELIAQADALYAEMKDMATAQEALTKYMDALLKIDDKYDVYWKIARMHYYIGAHTEKNKDKKIIFEQGIYYGKKAVELKPDRPDGYYWLGVVYGVYGEARGVLKSLFLVDDIKEAMNKVIEIDRSYEDGGPDRVLGRVYFKLPGFAGGDNKKSLEHLLKSKEFGPNDPVTRIYLADTYLELKQVDKAREELEFVLNMPPDSRWVSGVDDNKALAQEMLKRKEFQKKG
jgi:tetratricopeptide (TPR) repeat protein